MYRLKKKNIFHTSPLRPRDVNVSNATDTHVFLFLAVSRIQTQFNDRFASFHEFSLQDTHESKNFPQTIRVFHEFAQQLEHEMKKKVHFLTIREQQR
jgi:hypothetical protein